MSIVPLNAEGSVFKTPPLVTIYERHINGLVFRYAIYQNEAYISLKDVATQIKLANPSSSAKNFHRRYKTKLSTSFKKFRALTPGGPQTLLFANLEATNIFCSRSRNVQASIDYINKLTQFQEWFLSTQRDPIVEQTNKIKGDYNFLSSEVKFLHDNNSEIRRDINKLAQAIKQLQTQLDVNINRFQVKQIYDFVQQKLAVIIAEKRGLAKPTSLVYKDCWTAFNNHFNIASYRDLPASQFEDAKEYLLYQIEKVSKELE